MSICGFKDIILRVKRYHLAVKMSFLDLEKSFYDPLDSFGNKNIPFYGPTKVVIFWVYRHHFVTVQLSLCGSKRLTQRV